MVLPTPPPERLYMRRQDLGLPPLVRPRSHNEVLVCSVYAAAFRLDLVSLDDDFYQLGGDSLVAVELASRLSTQFGSGVAVSAIAEITTPRTLSAYLDGEKGRQPPPISAGGAVALPINTGPVEQRLFVMHVALGQLSNYHQLAQNLDQTHLMTGIRPDATRLDRPEDRSVEEDGRCAAACLLAHGDAESPVILGYSYGGWVALEAARAVMAAGIAQPRVILLDPLALWTDRMAFARVLKRKVFARETDEALRLFLHHTGLRRGGASEMVLAQSRSLAYRPRPLSHTLTRALYVQAQDTPFPKASIAAYRRLVGPDLEVVQMPYSHYTLKLQTGATELAGLLAAWLDKTKPTVEHSMNIGHE